MLNAVWQRAKACALAVLKRGKLLALAALLTILDVGPDLLNAVAGVDWNPLLPPGWGTTIAGWLAVLRLVLPLLAARRRQPPGSGGSV